MVPTKTNQNWLPSIFNDFFNNEWMMQEQMQQLQLSM